MFINYNQMCCGLRELHYLSSHRTPEDAMIAFGRTIYPTEKEIREQVAKAQARAAAAKVSPYTNGYIGQGNRTEDQRRNVLYEDPVQYGRFRFITFAEALNPNHINSNGTEVDGSPDYGRKFAAFIQANKLGEVTSTGRHVNPNSGNHLKIFIWAIDHGELQKWLKKQPEYVKLRKAAQEPDTTTTATIRMEPGLIIPAPLGGIPWGENQTYAGQGSANSAAPATSEQQQTTSRPTQSYAGGPLPSASSFLRSLLDR